MLAKNLKKYRQVKGMSQQQLAETLGLSRSNIASYEEGRAMPKTDNLLAIAKTIGTSTENLTQRELTVNELLGFFSPTSQSGSIPPSKNTVHIYDEGRSSSPERMIWNTSSKSKRIGMRVLSNRIVHPEVSQGDILFGELLQECATDQLVLVKHDDQVWAGYVDLEKGRITFPNRNHPPLKIENPEHLEVFGVQTILKSISL